MKTNEEIVAMSFEVAQSTQLKNLHGMTFKEGVEMALEWVLEEVSDEELLNLEE